MPAISQAIDIALEHHRAGRLDTAAERSIDACSPRSRIIPTPCI